MSAFKTRKGEQLSVERPLSDRLARTNKLTAFLLFQSFEFQSKNVHLAYNVSLDVFANEVLLFLRIKITMVKIPDQNHLSAGI